MIFSKVKQKIIFIIVLIGALLIFIFQQGLYTAPQSQTGSTEKKEVASENSEPTIISTSPSPLNEAIILPTTTIEIHFNRPLENRGEFKHKLEPKIDYEVKLSDDRKTAKIIPSSTFALGTTYTLFIYANETKFDGGKRLNQDYTYHFKTIEYKGV